MNVDLNKNLEALIKAYLSPVQNYLLAFTFVMIIIHVAYQIGTRLINPEKEAFEPKMFVGIGLTVLGLIFYNQFIDLTINIPMKIIDSIVDAGIMRMTGAQDITNIFENYSTATSVDKKGLENILDIHPLAQVAHLLFGIVARVSMYVVFIVAQLNQAFLYALGVFVFPFSMIISNKSLIGTWYFSFLAAKFTIPVCKTLVAIVSILPFEDYLQSSSQLLNNDIMQAVFYLIMELMAVFLVLSSSQVANKLISSSASSMGISDLMSGKATLVGVMGTLTSALSSKKKEEKTK